MARHANNGTSSGLDDRPEERESAVRHAHAERARQHGRAAAPGYLGVPVQDVEPDQREPGQVDGEESSEEHDGSKGDPERNPSTRAPRARASGKAGQSEASKGSSPASARRRGGGTRRSAASGESRKPASSRQTPRPSRAPRKGAQPAGKRKATSAGSGAAKSRSPGGNGKAGKGAASAAADSVKSKLSSAAESGERAVRGERDKLPRRIAAELAKRALGAGGRMAAHGLRRVGMAGADALIEGSQRIPEALAERTRRLPIQQSIDVAVPLEVAWEQWMEFCYFPEGAHRARNVEREGETLIGELDGPGSREWKAEIIDERENESFAWRSSEGSDSAGLVTFHELSERLTRIELNLDVRPTHVAEAAALALHVADRRVETELRRFKAHVELLSPDVYDELLSANGNGSATDSRG
jgi:uncharacterized membrane protein